MTCQLPATSPAAASFKMGFANGRLWLYNQGTSQWESYITVEQCAETLASITETSCFSYTVPSGNQTYTLLYRLLVKPPEKYQLREMSIPENTETPSHIQAAIELLRYKCLNAINLYPGFRGTHLSAK